MVRRTGSSLTCQARIGAGALPPLTAQGRVAVAEFRVAHRPLIAGVVHDPPVPGDCRAAPPGPAGPRPPGVQPPGPDRADPLESAASGGPPAGTMGMKPTSSSCASWSAGNRWLGPLGGGQLGPGHYPAVHPGLGAAQDRGAPGGRRAACRPAGRPARRRRRWYQRVCSALRDRVQVLLAQLDEAARAGPRGPGTHCRPRAATADRMRAELEDVVLAEERVEVGPGQPGGALGMPGRQRMAQPVALVPVPGDPGPGVLRHLAVDEQAGLERVQQVEDGAAHAFARGGEHEHGDTPGAAGPPAPPRACRSRPGRPR